MGLPSEIARTNNGTVLSLLRGLQQNIQSEIKTTYSYVM